MPVDRQFRDLSIGQSFDFISPIATHNSFYLTCTKISARQYRDERGTVHTVGSVKANVYHVK
jgi:hypothetical protein